MNKPNKSSKVTKATKKAAKPQAKTNTPAKVGKPTTAKKTATTAKPAKVEAVKATEKTAKPPGFTPVALPAKFAKGRTAIEVTPKMIKFCCGLTEVIFSPLNVHYFAADVSEVNGERLKEPVKAGSLTLYRGTSSVIIPPENTAEINAILTAKAAAKAAKAKKGGAA